MARTIRNTDRRQSADATRREARRLRATRRAARAAKAAPSLSPAAYAMTGVR